MQEQQESENTPSRPDQVQTHTFNEGSIPPLLMHVFTSLPSSVQEQFEVTHLIQVVEAIYSEAVH